MRLHPDPVFDRLLGDPGAADPAAVAAACRRIGAGDLAGWERFWRGEGDGALRRADDRLAADDVSGARRGLLAAAEAYGLAAQPLPLDDEGRRADRAAQAAAFRAAMPLLPTEVEIVGPTAYRFGTTGRACVVVPMPHGLPVEAGYARFAVPALGHGLDCVVLEDDTLPGSRPVGPPVIVVYAGGGTVSSPATAVAEIMARVAATARHLGKCTAAARPRRAETISERGRAGGRTPARR